MNDNFTAAMMRPTTVTAGTIDCSKIRVLIPWRGQMVFLDDLPEREKVLARGKIYLEAKLAEENAEPGQNRSMWQRFYDQLR